MSMFKKNKNEETREKEIAATSEAIDRLVEIDLDKDPNGLDNISKLATMNGDKSSSMFDSLKPGWCEMRTDDHPIGVDETNYSTNIPYSALEYVASVIKDEATIKNFSINAYKTVFAVDPKYKFFIENDKDNACASNISTEVKIRGKVINITMDYHIAIPVYPTDKRGYDDWFVCLATTRVVCEFNASESDEVINTTTSLLCTTGKAVMERSLTSNIAKAIGIDVDKVMTSLCGTVVTLSRPIYEEEKIIKSVYTSLPVDIVNIMVDEVEEE